MNKKVLIGFLSVIMVVIATTALSQSAIPASMAFQSPVDTPTPESTATPTFTPTKTPTATRRPSPTATKTPQPTPVGNLLVNGWFLDGFFGWEQENGYWTLHGPRPCEPSGSKYVQMDNDHGIFNWPIGAHDWIWQDIQTGGASHTKIIFSMIEAHHMQTGVAEITIYGSNDGSNWVQVYHRPGVESPYGTGKCGIWGPPSQFSYEIDTPGYIHYKFEIHGQIGQDGDAFLFGGLSMVLQ